jgi:hypothetical protein
VAWERVKNPNLRYNTQQVSHHVSSDFCDVTPWHAMLTEDQFNTLVAPREYLWWDVADKRMLSLESVVEGILTKGDLDDVKELLDEIGIPEVRRIFEQQIQKERCNYRPPTINYFSLYFAHHA